MKLKIKLSDAEKQKFEQGLILEIEGRRFIALDKEVSQILSYKLLYAELSKIRSKSDLDELLKNARETLLYLGVSEEEIQSLSQPNESVQA